MEKKHKLIAGGVIVGILLIVLIWVYLPSSGGVDPKAAEEAKAAAQAMQAQEEANPAPPPPPPPPGITSKAGVPRK